MKKLLVRSFEFIVRSAIFLALFLLLPTTNYPFGGPLLTTFAQQSQQATLALSPATGTFNRGCNFSLNIDLNTNGAQTDGTDAILIYDSTRFTANSIQSGTIYPDYPGNNIDEAAGKITVSGLASVAQAFTGQGVLATINFT